MPRPPIGTVAEFTSDVAAKQDAASPELRRAIDSLARPQLERLMQLHADTMRTVNTSTVDQDIQTARELLRHGRLQEAEALVCG